MKRACVLLIILTASVSGQMEKRLRVLYDREAFRKRSPAVGKQMADLTLRNLTGKKVALSSLRKKPLVIVGGAYT